jgi:hypothetical protein
MLNEIRETVVWYYGKVRSYVQPYIRINDKYDMILDYLYISDFPAACNLPALKQQGITHIITIIPGVGPMFPQDFTYLTLDVYDVPSANISDQFSKCIDFIRKAKAEQGKILVHCMCGISRSATVACAYLISDLGYSALSAINFIKGRRDLIRPNPGFVKQLITFEETSTACTSTQL